MSLVRDDLTATRLLVDTHVHYHACFTWSLFLDTTAANFARARRRLGLTEASAGCLMFTESVGMNYCRWLMEGHARSTLCGWAVATGDDGCSVVLTRAGQASILIVAGRQIVTAERLEVLALGCTQEFTDGRPIRDVVRAVSAAGAVPVIPWGYGKWLGRRARILKDLIESPEENAVCLGDNGGRMRLMPRPRTLSWAERRGIVVLAGSDPLPLRSHATRAGSYGCVLEGWVATSTPGAAITARLRALRQSPPVFGALSSLPMAVRSQVGIRLWHPAPSSSPA